MPNAACSHKVSSSPLQRSGGAKDANGTRYLEFAVHGGFNNQRRNLFHALLVAHALNRTLLLPPALSHRLSPHYGQCPGHVAPPDAILARSAKAAADQEAAAARKERRRGGDASPLAASSLSRLLNFSGVADLVRVRDLARVDDGLAAATLKSRAARNPNRFKIPST